jgi:hypothetical protein
MTHSLSKVLAQKFGYSDIEAMKMDSRKRFSLVENGIVDQASTRLLLINVSRPFFALATEALTITGDAR